MADSPDPQYLAVLKGIEDALEVRNARPQWIHSVVSGGLLAGLVALGGFVGDQARTNQELVEKLEALTARVDSNQDYIGEHEPTIEARDTRQCAQLMLLGTAVGNIHNSVKRLSESAIYLEDVPRIDCGPGAYK